MSVKSAIKFLETERERLVRASDRDEEYTSIYGNGVNGCEAYEAAVPIIDRVLKELGELK